MTHLKNIKRISITAGLIALFSFSLTGSAPAQAVEVWNQVYNGTASSQDFPVAVKTDGQGDVLVAGSSIGTGSGFDIVLNKYGRHGNLLWSRRYNGAGNSADEPAGLGIDNANNIYVTGYTTSATGMVYVTLKYNANGTQQWVRLYDGASGVDQAKGIDVDGDGNAYVTGSSSAGDVCTTIKYDTDGNQVWLANYNNNAPGGGADSGQAILLAGSALYVTGYTRNSGNGEDVLLIKYNTNGAQQWVRTFNGSFGSESGLGLGTYPEDIGMKLAVDNVGNIYVGGRVMTGITQINGSDEPLNDYVLLKWNSNGTAIWSKTFGTASVNDELTDMVMMSSARFALTGTGGTVAYNESGGQVFSKTIAGNALATDRESSLYVASVASSNIRTTKYTFAGSFKWQKEYAGPGNGADVPLDMLVTNTGTIYLTGYTYGGANQSNNFVTLKYVQAPYVQVQVDHTYINDLVIEVGVGNPANPLWSKTIRNREGGNANGTFMTAEGVADAPAYYQIPNESVVWYCKVRDALSQDSGHLQLFNMTGSNGIGHLSGNVVQAIPDLGTVFAYVPTRANHHMLLDIKHTYRGDLTVTVGTGDPNSPTWSRIIVMSNGVALNDMWCQVDLTGLPNLPPSANDPWWVKIDDVVGGDTGQLDMFRIQLGNVQSNARCLPRFLPDMDSVIVYNPLLGGDVNCDGCVDDRDLLMVLFAFGNTGLNMPEDLNGDHVIDDNDLLQVLFNFGKGC